MIYRTEQRKNLERIFEENPEKFFSVEDILEELNKKGESVGQTTVYRAIKRLEENELLRTEVRNNTKYYQYITNECNGHFHLKCKKCGKVIHLECREFEEVNNHIQEHHKFKVDHNMIIYGICDKCSSKEA